MKDNEERYKLFCEIVRAGWLRPSHRDILGTEFTGHINGQKLLSSNEAVNTACVCFCDIPLDALSIHIKKYGPFGIAFAKKFLVSLEATPLTYVEQNAAHQGVGQGPRTLGEKLDQIRAKMQQFEADLASYVEPSEGCSPYLMGRSPAGTPPGHVLRGQFASIKDDLEFGVLGQFKFFDSRLAEDHPKNYYMEREWRVQGGVAFRLGNIARLVMPGDFIERFRADAPDYCGEITDPENVSAKAPGK